MLEVVLDRLSNLIYVKPALNPPATMSPVTVPDAAWALEERSG